MLKVLKIFSENKKTLILIMGLGLFLSLVPSHLAQAGVWENIEGILTYIATWPLKIMGLTVALILLTLGLLAGVLCFIAIGFLSWIKTICLSIPATHGGVVDIGWTFTRDFANMFFILILVFIGLATILKIKDYEAKKTLPLLILIALLINFSPVVVGFVVDITNLITNFFLNQIGSFDWNTFKTILEMVWGPLKTSLGSFVDFKADFLQVIGQVTTVAVFGLVLIAFFTYATATYVVVSVFLFARILYLWILTILAPIAFLSYVFPATRKIYMIGWDNWWGQLLQWSIIGIPIGFFLYLSNWIMSHQGVINSSFQSGGLSTAIIDPNLSISDIMFQGFANIFSNMLAPLVALVILYMGVELSKKLAPAAALQIIEGVKKAGKMIAMSGIAAATLGAGAIGVAGLMGKASAGAAKFEAAAGKVPGIGKGLQLGIAKPISWATRGAERVAVPPLLKYAAAVRTAKIPEEFEKMTPDEQQRYTEAQLTKGARIQYAAKMADLGTLGKTPPQFQEKMAAEAEEKADDRRSPHLKPFSEKIFDVLPDKLTARAKIALESTPETKREMQGKINEMAEGITIEAKVNPDLDNEIIKQAAKKFKVPVSQVTDDMKNATVENIAAGAVHTKELKPKDMAGMAKGSVKSLAFRWGMRHGTSAKMQKILDSFDKDTVENVLDGTGGLNQAFDALKNQPEEQKRVLKNLQRDNESFLKWFFTAPAGKSWKFRGREIIEKPAEEGGYGGYDKFATQVRPIIEKEKEEEKARKDWGERGKLAEEELAERMAKEKKEKIPKDWKKKGRREPPEPSAGLADRLAEEELADRLTREKKEKIPKDWKKKGGKEPPEPSEGV